MSYFVSLEVFSFFFFSWSLIFFFCLEQTALSSRFVRFCVCFYELGKTVISPGLVKEDPVSCEGRRCVCWVASVGSSNWSEQESGGNLFSLFFFKKFFLSGAALIQGLSQWLTCSTGDAGNLGSIPGSERYPGGGHGNPLQYFAWRIPWTEEPGRLQSVGLRAVGYN